MHNLLSRNQLAEWVHIDVNLNRCNEELDLVNDYFDCLIECDEDQATCKRICRILLNTEGWSPSFLCYNIFSVYFDMDRERLKLMVRNLELLVDSLKAEVYSDPQAYKTPDKNDTLIGDYDEIFDDDDGYPD